MSDVVFSIMARVGLTPRNLVYKRRVGKSESSDTQNAVDEKSEEKKLLDREDEGLLHDYWDSLNGSEEE